MSKFKVGDKAVLTPEATEKYKRLIKECPDSGWNENFVRMAIDGIEGIISSSSYAGKTYLFEDHFWVYENELKAVDSWIEWNGGECPVPTGTLVDVRYRNGTKTYGVSAGTTPNSPHHVKGDGEYYASAWSNYNLESDIVAYKLHLKEEEVEKVDVSVENQQTEWTDKHYDFSYKLSEKDIENGFVKVDPYFVARVWQLGKKDDSGVLFHNLKNISRYGEKNSKEREIKALYAQVKRLAELEGVVLG